MALRRHGLANGTTFGPLRDRDRRGGTRVAGRNHRPGANPDLLGPGRSAEMTYYETPAGAKVFAAGAINFAATATDTPVSTMLENLWTRLTAP
jgi:hypothetical protein